MRACRHSAAPIWGLLLVLGLSWEARGQPFGGEPRYGSLEVSGPLQLDPVGFGVMAGGGEAMLDLRDLGLIDAAAGTACGSFYVTEAPSFRLEVGSSVEFFRLYVEVPAPDSTDPALLVHQPDGTWRCVDDARVQDYAGLMPVLDFDSPTAGTYDVWVGTYDRLVSAPAMLLVTESKDHLPGR